MRKETRNKIIAFSIPLVILVGMTVRPVMTVLTGDEVKLATKPVDPRDLFRGDYVTLGYEAEEIPENKLDNSVKEYFLEKNAGSVPFKPLVVYSVLKENKEGIHEVQKVIIEKPDSGLYLKGEIVNLWLKTDEEIREYTETEQEFLEEKESQTAYIDYQLDKYFVPENTGKELEDAINDFDNDGNEERESNATATVKVRNGHAVLTNVEVEK